MVKHYISQEEEFPVYDLCSGEGILPSKEVELPDGFIKRYKVVIKEWEEVQTIMGNAWDNAE